MIKEDKKGQFYLLAAVVIIVVIVSFAAVMNYASQSTSTKLYDVKDELGIESGKVLDYGTIQGENITENGKEVNIIDHFIEKYDEYAGEDREIFFVFGNPNKVTLITYDDITQGSIQLVSGESRPTYDVVGKEIVRQTIDPNDEGVVSVIIGENKYDFELKPGENFYFIISQQVGEEQVVVTS